MSGYNADLMRARVKQRWFYLAVLISVSSVLLVLLTVFLLMKVTAVEVLPDDASVTSVIHVESGIGFSMGSKVYTFSSDSSLSVAAKGFVTRVVEIPAEHSGLLPVELVEMEGKLRAITDSGSDAIRWFLGGRLVAVSGELAIDLKPGHYLLEVDSRYHERKALEVVLTRGEEKRLVIDLPLVSGHIDIASEPSGIPVIVDGEMKGMTPVSGQYAGGAHRVEIVTPDFETITDQVEVTNVLPRVSRHYRLQPKKSYLSFDLLPEGGDLLVDGRKVDPASQVAISAGVKSTVTYLKEGYFSESRGITLGAGEESRIVFHLQPEKGLVDIRSDPVADIFINGKPHGKTPLVVSLLAVKQQISLSREGYRSVGKIVMPSSEKTVVFSTMLQDERSARLAEAKRFYQNDIGIEFKLFIPSPFKMGAARHERGQRANEFERDVILKKPFYAALKEVTVGQYSHFRKRPEAVSSPGDYPVTSVSWLDAAMFCNWLSAREKLDPFYIVQDGMLKDINRASDGYRLLSEAEWEWLARKAGRKTQTTFTWGNQFVVPPASGNIADEAAKHAVKVFVPHYNDGYEKLSPVGRFASDKAGLHDLTGNVSEWVHDYYSLVPPKKKAREIDPLGHSRGINHVIKGSSWQSGTLTELRASFRDGAVTGGEDIGFRVARYLYGEEGYGD